MARWSLFAAAAFVLAGCGMGDTGADIQVAPEELSGPTSAQVGKALSLPGDRPFNIHLKNSSQSPGAQGRARGDSDAAADGQAFCLAEAANGGESAAEFKLGQRVTAGESGPKRLAIQVQFQLRHSMLAPANPAARTQASVSLQLLALDSRRRVLARSPLIEANSDESVGSAAETHERSLAVELEARETCDIILVAKVQAASASGEEADARLDLRQLRMTLDFQPLATQPSGTPPSTASAQ